MAFALHDSLIMKGTLEKIISGGQTGVDRAALDIAMELGIPCGGWCPQGRRTEGFPVITPGNKPLLRIIRSGPD